MPPLVATSRARLESLTGLRFFAAYLVLLHHFANFASLPVLDRYYGFGASGVSFFFVLSGFVLTWSFRPGDRAERFYWRRFARIWPLHALTTLIAIPVFYTWRDVPYEWTGILLSFALLHAWVPTASIYFAGNPASWSLSCEAFFYAVHPLLVRRTLALRLAAGGAAAVAVLATIGLFAELSLDWPARITGWFVYVSPLFRLGEFLFGMLLAAALRRGFRSPIGLVPALLLLAAWVQVVYIATPRWFSAGGLHLVGDLDYVVLPVCYGLIVYAAAQRDVAGVRSILRSRPLVLLGQWSYALYLVHATVIYALIEITGYSHPSALANVLWLLAVTAVTIPISAALYHLFEHPAEQRLRPLNPSRWLRRSPAVVPAPVAPAPVEGGG